MRISRALQTAVTLGGVSAIALLVAMPRQPQTPAVQTWYGYGANSQHTSLSTVSAGNEVGQKWSAPVDYHPQNAGSTHYASPSITAANTVVLGVKTGESGDWLFQGRSGTDGAVLWTQTTDYVAPPTADTVWTGIYPMGLVQSAAVGAGGGGTLYVKENADLAASALNRLCFYQPIANYLKNPSIYAGITINTPITGDKWGNLYFGYWLNSGVDPTTAAKLGTGGIVRMTLAGTSVYVPAASLVPSNPGDVCYPGFNAAPALMNSLDSVYVSITNATQGKYYLVKLANRDLTVQASVRLLDPANGKDAFVWVGSSASPMVAPDNQVFYGVLRNNDSTSHGWMLQFDSNLNQFNAQNVRYPVGAFGWDDTPAVVPAAAVKSYKGRSAYLILTKYNNYFNLAGGDGRNHLAVLDPRNDNLTTDRITGIPTMNEVLLVLGPTCDSDNYACTSTTNPATDPAVPVREWCINAAAIDPVNRQAIVNSEDGNCYRWSFDTNTLVQAQKLNAATGEPYTCTAIGPDGTCYIINDGRVHAVFLKKPVP